MHYMVAVDGSEGGNNALNYCLTNMAKETDSLFLVSVSEKIPLASAGVTPGVSYSYVIEAQEEVKKQTKRNLLRYVKLAKDAGVKDVHPLLGSSFHVGETLCQAAVSKEADVLVVGARGLGAFARFVLGSTSRYVVEHAACNVVVVKRPPPSNEEHVSLDEITRLEEAERKRRMGEADADKGLSEDNRKALDLHIARMAEEEERWRRVHQHHEIPAGEQKKHLALLEAIASKSEKKPEADTHLVDLYDFKH